MEKRNFCRSILLLTLLLLFRSSIAQNLFANPGFEDLNVCTEYHSVCAPEAWYYIKPTTNPLVKGSVVPRPLLGANLLLVPVHNVFDSGVARSYVYTMLACPLVAGEVYKLSFYINTSKRKFYNIDFLFSENEPATKYFNTTVKPTFSITENDIVAEMKQKWMAVEHLFMATGKERFCMLGNMSAAMKYDINDRMSASGNIFYFLDEIKVLPVGNIPICKEYEENIKMMYAQNYRHTEFTLVDTVAVKPKSPVFITDTINIPSLFFENNSAALKPSFKVKLDSLCNILISKKIARIDIVGHTDNKGDPEKNISLSLARANAVKDYFTGKFSQYRENIFGAGKGQNQPIDTNTTAEGRAKNRRVEIILTIFDER